MLRATKPRSRRMRYETLENRLVMSATVGTAAWFDANLHNAAVRNLAKADFQDSVLSRSDMVGLLRQVEKSGVTAKEFADLKTIVNTASLFAGVDYVRALSSYVVLGNPANAHFQGSALGNLKAGFSAAKMEKLIGKWFFGTDHPKGTSDWGPTYSYRQASGQLFVGGVEYADVNQGGLGDCYFLASLAEVALKDPNAITSMFIVNGDATYTVRFYQGAKAQYVTVDSQLPTDANGYLVFDGMGRQANSASNELWVELAEKAYVQMNEMGWIRPSSWGGGQNKYTGISGGCMYMALAQITGRATVAFTSTASSGGFNTVVAAFDAGESICFGSKDYPLSSSVVGNHAYAVVGYSATAQTITLFNPWGINNGSAPGLVTLTWAQIQGSFDYFDRTA